ncbi:hypothetical protein FGB62_22g344 [Gracilaria domingensis]|nr:hypothetical protein FGB62_22g344 [Gracilaria domingensis]
MAAHDDGCVQLYVAVAQSASSANGATQGVGGGAMDVESVKYMQQREMQQREKVCEQCYVLSDVGTALLIASKASQYQAWASTVRGARGLQWYDGWKLIHKSP